MKNHCISPKFKTITFDQYQITQKNLLRAKTDSASLHKKPFINLQLILRDDKSLSNNEIKEVQSARANTLQDLYAKNSVTRRKSHSIK